MNHQLDKEIKEKWGKTDAYKEYSDKAKNYTSDKWEIITEKMSKIFTRFSEFKRSEKGFNDIEVQKLVEELKIFISENFYNCTNSILISLGQMYVTDERFTKNIDKDESGTAQFVKDAIEFYCSNNI